ncbi:5-oxoprolinase subunit PxpB [Marinobacter salinexigens]|uniref:5-oxoprolinase subunit PxpB n=1 Tax=Marinobacter salinexigens TaxID=2919747 RepID=A0A5B0VKJ6_9GAMM|nr:5-oxoprolinase subunit PxpB [Marinobacter salinexigens]KAA1174853.1 5-oxoprolinase subunit PxpB [Marinobacter salinexigens]
MNRSPRIENAGVGAWLVRLFDMIEEQNLPWVMALARECEQTFGVALIDLVPSYTTLLVQYDPLRMSPDQARGLLQQLVSALAVTDDGGDSPVRELPVWYDPSVGPELLVLAEGKGLSVTSLIELHTAPVYQVFALGFAPGFAFMGSVDPELRAPRLATPRKRVYPGSVAIAGSQTSAYPAASPGGWNLIGRTPTVLFDRNREQMSYFQVGDKVRMVSVSKDEFLRLGGDTTPQEADG